jgi:hypothetical protein
LSSFSAYLIASEKAPVMLWIAVEASCHFAVFKKVLDKSAKVLLVFFIDNSELFIALTNYEKAYCPYGPIEIILDDKVSKSKLALLKLLWKAPKSSFPVETLVAFSK